MSLSWRDAAATTLTGAAAAVTYARIQGVDWPLLDNWRTSTLVLFAIGLSAYIVAGFDTVPPKSKWTTVATTLGSLAVVLAVMGLALGNQIIFFALAATIAALWILATAHHLLTPGGSQKPIVYYRADSIYRQSDRR